MPNSPHNMTIRDRLAAGPLLGFALGAGGALRTASPKIGSSITISGISTSYTLTASAPNTYLLFPDATTNGYYDNGISISVSLSGLSAADMLEDTSTGSTATFSGGTLTLSETVPGANLVAALDAITLVLGNGDTLPPSEVVNISVGGTDDYFNGLPNDGGGGYYDPDVGYATISPQCFLRGTRILTPAGETPIESLAIGDQVVIENGGEKMPAHIRWIGRQTISTRFADKLKALPIRIKAGALGDTLPARDLLLSASHAILIDGILVQAGALVNGTTIVRETAVPEIITYYHLELDQHALLLAEGLQAESFLDGVEELPFDNRDERPAAAADLRELPYPRAQSHRQVPHHLRARLAARAAALTAPPAMVA